jgi:cyclic pyranopterin phosphate synthase
MKDRFGREVDYLRVSVTDRCNLRCVYCMPNPSYEPIPRDDILSFDEIEEVVRAAARLGFRHVRLTGGEPLLRRDLERLVARLARVEGIDDLALTTNGILLERLARPLKQAGLGRVNVSLDAIDPDRYAAITGGGRLDRVLAGIDAAIEAGLVPLKLNCVIETTPLEPDARGVAEFAASRGLELRYIPRMDIERGLFSQVIGGRGGDCPSCSRLRISCDGFVLPCLFSEPAFRVRELGADEALRRAIEDKPEAGGRCSWTRMHGIGG